MTDKGALIAYYRLSVEDDNTNSVKKLHKKSSAKMHKSDIFTPDFSEVSKRNKYGMKIESNSITNQRLLIQSYISTHSELKSYEFSEFYEMKTTSLIQFNYSSRNFILGCISWVHKILLPKGNAPKCTQSQTTKNPAEIKRGV